MREWNGRYRDDQRGGLAWKLYCKGRSVVDDVVDHRGISIVTGSTEEKRGEKQEIHSKPVHNKTTGRARRVLTRCYTLQMEGKTFEDEFPALGEFRTGEREGTVQYSAC